MRSTCMPSSACPPGATTRCPDAGCRMGVGTVAEASRQIPIISLAPIFRTYDLREAPSLIWLGELACQRRLSNHGRRRSLHYSDYSPLTRSCDEAIGTRIGVGGIAIRARHAV